ncbi:MAG TPA: thioredoxin family protein [Bacteroidales bacterium]|nr:thioredoxin family protein [Bacteroidales bacterium]
MKKLRIILLGLLAIMPLSMLAQPINETIIEPSDSSLIADGYFDKHLFESSLFKDWFQYEYESYKPDKKAMKTLTRKLPAGFSVIIVMGTWCPDSRREVPRFYKIADLINIKTDAIIGIAVNRVKTTEHVNMGHLKIERVPTFIVYNEGKELGRIIETPHQSLEKDLLEIIKKKPE